MAGSTFYLAALAGEETDVIRERLARISGAAGRILDAIDADVEEY